MEIGRRLTARKTAAAHDWEGDPNQADLSRRVSLKHRLSNVLLVGRWSGDLNMTMFQLARYVLRRKHEMGMV